MPSKRHQLAPHATGPLKGVRVIDLTSVILGAYATQMLADMGAEVIKVEVPSPRDGEGGDIMRWAGDTPTPEVRDLGPIFMTINRNKRGLLLDLRDPQAMARLKALISTADVFAASVRYDGLVRLGLSYEAVKAIRPDIVYVHAAGYGADGPYAGDPAYDDLIQAGSGFADLLNRTDGNPTPRVLPSLIADKVSGLFMAQATLAALLHRERTGEGQFVETPMLECMTSFNLAEHLFGHTFDPPTGPWSYTRVTNPNRRPYPTKDGHIGLLAYTDKQWNDFIGAAGWTERLAGDERLTTFITRAAHIRDVYALVDRITPEKTSQEWLDLLKPLQVPVVRMNRLDDLMDDPHLDAVGLFQTYAHPDVGDYVSMRPPVNFSATPSNIYLHPPRLGEHNAELLAEADAILAAQRDEA